MKLKLTLLAAVAVTLGLYSCSKKPDTAVYYMNASVGNNQYVAANCIAKPQNSAIIINGLGNSSYIPVYPYISIVLAHWNEAIDSFKLDSTMKNNYAVYYNSPTDYKVSKSGVVFISSFNAVKMSGQFHFTCTDSTQVSAGAFVAGRQQ